MTETELRQKVVDTASSWLGTQEGSSRHAEMLNIYNAQRPLPRGTRMLASWPWCAAFVSTVSLQLGLRDIMPTECGCPGMVRLYQDLGRWMEDDAYIPSPADVVFYDWQDTGYGDNAGQPDHVGIVVACTDGMMTIIEGNCDNAVKLRQISVNARFIRGYGCPDYASKADGTEPHPAPEPEPEPRPRRRRSRNRRSPPRKRRLTRSSHRLPARSSTESGETGGHARTHSPRGLSKPCRMK